jgi:hypothetical protein
MRGKADLPSVVILRWLEAGLLLIFPHGKTAGFLAFSSRSGLRPPDSRVLYFVCRKQPDPADIH